MSSLWWIRENEMTWEEVVKFLYAKGAGADASGALRRQGIGTDTIPKRDYADRAWAITLHEYTTARADERATRTNDLRYARQLDGE